MHQYFYLYLCWYWVPCTYAAKSPLWGVSSPFGSNWFEKPSESGKLTKLDAQVHAITKLDLFVYYGQESRQDAISLCWMVLLVLPQSTYLLVYSLHHRTETWNPSHRDCKFLRAQQQFKVFTVFHDLLGQAYWLCHAATQFMVNLSLPGFHIFIFLHNESTSFTAGDWLRRVAPILACQTGSSFPNSSLRISIISPIFYRVSIRMIQVLH